ncbi:MAG TPA: hypothetical protein VK756_08385 [Solirubrobacteraceae bacterium]|jgi:hypothetical protein|nr:hypothetical protein [Solirubrobacteraceae bacterium]
MLLALGAPAIVAAVLLWELSLPRLRVLAPKLAAMFTRARERAARDRQVDFDPGRERRAERRARALLRSCVNDEEWSMYRDLGFLRVSGGGAPHGNPAASYAYLIYPHRPIVAYLPQTGALLNEYCVAFPDHSRPYGSTRLPDADDVLAKWMALTADERRLIADANMHLPGRQLDPEQVRDDLARLARWERGRSAWPEDARATPKESARAGTADPVRAGAKGVEGRERVAHARRAASSVPAR